MIKSTYDTTKFVSVENGKFKIGDKPYYFLGANFWYGINLGATGVAGNRERLIRELDNLKSLGINNLRIMAGSEGPDTEPYRMAPALQTEPGVYNHALLEGLDFLLVEMKKRNMYAVVCLTNFWNWSGGLAQYLVWSGKAESILYPPPHPGGTWEAYQKFTAQFYSSETAKQLFYNHVSFIIARENLISGVRYTDDTTIMAWELANEPRGVNNKAQYLNWIRETAALIKSKDSNHLVTVGSEGKTSSSFSGVDPETDHSIADIDYVTIHIWVQNWEIYNPNDAKSTLPIAIGYALSYINEHEAIARKLNKPLVLEEFGISRDRNDHHPDSPIVVRDQFYKALFEFIYEKMQMDRGVVAGCNFWAWGGEGRPQKPEGLWKINDDFIGDPPHEPQGWYSVYDHDYSTLQVIKKSCEKINGLTETKLTPSADM